MSWDSPKEELEYIQRALKWARDGEKAAQRRIAYYSEREQELLDLLKEKEYDHFCFKP